jgi:hypothetical protein
MPRRLYAPFFAKRYVGNTESKVLHDLDNEKKECKISEIDSRFGLAMFEWFSVPKEMGYKGCQYCMPDFETRKN